MSSAKFGKHLVDSFLGPNQNRHSKCPSERLRTPDYLYRYMNNFKQPEMSIAEPKFGRGKRIKVWMNGEAHCYEFNINPKDFRSWTSILLHITNSVKPIFGAVRKLVALSSLKSVDNFEALDPKERYVGLGATCRFKMAPGGYRTSSEKELYKREKVTKRFYSGEMNSKVLPFLMETEKKKLTIIYVAVNGRNYQSPQKLVLNSNDMRNWVLIFKYLTKVLDIPDGIACICTIFGDVLRDPSELQHGYLYVAVPFKENFIHMSYISLFEDQNKYRSGYTLTIRPAPSPPEKLYTAIKKIKKRISSSEFYDKVGKLPSRPTTPLQKKRCSKISIKQEPRNMSSSKQVPQKKIPTRCESQPTGQVTSLTEPKLPARCDSEPAQTASIIQEELADQMEAYEKTVADIEKKYSEDGEKITTCSNVPESTECQLESSSNSNQTSFAAFAAYSNKNVSVITGSQSESLDESPTYTVGKIPSARLRALAGCNLMTVVDAELSIKDHILDDASRDDKYCVREVNDKPDLQELSSVQPVQQSTIVIRNLRDQQKIKNGIIMSSQNAPTIHIRNRTDISIYNVKSGNYSGKKTSESNVFLERKSTNLRPQSYDELNKKQKNSTEKKTSRSKTTESASKNNWTGDIFIPNQGTRKKTKSKTFTLKLETLDNNSSVERHEELLSVEDSDKTDTEEKTSRSSSDAKPFISERGDILDSNRWNLRIERESESVVSVQDGVDFKVKENILEIKDVRKSLQKRIGIGSFRVSTPEVENCLRYSLGDGKYIKEDRSHCSISSDSIES